MLVLRLSLVGETTLALACVCLRRTVAPLSVYLLLCELWG